MMDSRIMPIPRACNRAIDALARYAGMILASSMIRDIRRGRDSPRMSALPATKEMKPFTWASEGG
jgi:hypothetical protein